MSVKTSIYWNPLLPEHSSKWRPVPGLEGMAEQVTLSMDMLSGECNRLLRFFPAADTSVLGSNSHEYPEEIIIISGSLYDAAAGIWLHTGSYTNRSPGEVHGPFRTDEGCVLLRISLVADA